MRKYLHKISIYVLYVLIKIDKHFSRLSHERKEDNNPYEKISSRMFTSAVNGTQWILR